MSDKRPSGPRSRRTVLLVTGLIATFVVVPVVVVAAVSAGPTGGRPGDGTPTSSGSAAAVERVDPVTALVREPPARICGNASLLDAGPESPPEGAVVVPAGDNSSMSILREPDKTFWFAPGVHTLGTEEFSQIIPGSRSTFVGAPGAVIDGQGRNKYAFTGEAQGVTLRYLTIRNFVSPLSEGAVNQNDGVGWLVEYSTISDNAGAGLMAGAADNTYRYNCIKDNGQYGVNACCGTPEEPVENLVLDHNEITGNNTGDWESRMEGCGCTGGVKFWINNDVAVTNNWIHDNRGVGLWLDNNNSGFVIEGNYLENNDSSAIILEAGYDARIRMNYFKRNAWVTGREFQSGGDLFPITAIYISENGSPDGHGLAFVPTVISDNFFEDNWGGVGLWESPDRYCSSTAHTHPPFCTIKVDLYDDSQCESAVEDVIPDSIGDKYRCRWSTENNIVENNVFSIDKELIGEGCSGADFCGVNGLFSGFGTYPEFSGYVIAWRMTYQQGNVFRNNEYIGDWTFAGFERAKPDGTRFTWEEWTAPAPPVPTDLTGLSPPTAFGQDGGSSFAP